MHTDPFHVLADDVRRQIIEALRRGERSVGDVVAELDIDQSGVSRHLHVLLEAGFVRVRADGQRRLYGLHADGFRALDRWLGAFRRLWAAPGARAATALKKSRVKRSSVAPPPRTRKTKRR